MALVASAWGCALGTCRFQGRSSAICEIRMLADAREHLAQERFRIVTIEFGGSEKTVERRRTIAAGIDAGE